ncbi:MAG: hypothetical protein ACRDPI_04515 [Nocardioidaceae bacterium]
MKSARARSLAVVSTLALLAATAACTHHAKPAAAGSPTPSVTATPVPLKVLVTRVSGKLSPGAQANLQASIGKAIDAYFDAAYLGGTYPRSDFSDALSQFPTNLSQQAKGDIDLITNATLGPTTQRVEAKTKTAYLSVLAPHKVAAGVSARVRLVYLDERGAKPAQQVTVTGRLTLTRVNGSSQWQIFGYSLARSAHSVKGS